MICSCHECLATSKECMMLCVSSCIKDMQKALRGLDVAAADSVALCGNLYHCIISDCTDCFFEIRHVRHKWGAFFIVIAFKSRSF